MNLAAPISGSRRIAYIIVLGAMTALGPFTIDTYLPALPQLEHDFNVPAAAIQLTLGTTIAGFAVGQLLVGPWSDRVGRRLPLLLTTTLHIVSSIACAFAPNVEVLAVFRALQGLGAAGGGVVALALVRDLFSGHRLIATLAGLSAVVGAAPAVAPVIGSQLLRVMPWRGIFWVLAAYGVLVLIALALLIREPQHARAEQGRRTLSRYRRLLTDPMFIGIVLVGAANFSGSFAYISSSAFLFQKGYGFTPEQFALVFATTAAGMILGAQSSARLVRRIGPQWILAISTVLGLVAAGLVILVGALNLNVSWLIASLALFTLATGAAFPCTQVLALDSHPEEAGTAASLLGAASFGAAGIVAPLVGVLGSSDPVILGAVLASCSLTAITFLWAIVRPWSVPPIGSHVQPEVD